MPISSKTIKKKVVKRASVERTRNYGTLTESEFWSRIRSALRSAFKFWKPMSAALEAASRPSQSENKLLKKEYQCAHCREWFPRGDVQIDHIIPCGSLRGFDDIKDFIERLTIEDPKGFQILCKEDHKKKTAEERKNKNNL
jgi:5-methylcytosine-specific restriction endonuclease McrA